MAVDLVTAGDVIDQRFRVDREVAAGGMGRIYRGSDRHTGQDVAIKVVSKPHAAAVARFAREAVLLAELQHPGVVEYVAHGHLPGGMLYLVMEWLEGETLSRRLRKIPSDVDPDQTQVEKPASGERSEVRRGRLPLVEVILVARRVSSILAAIHRRGITHRDLKPSNLVLVDGDIARIKLIDFGIARDPAAGQAVTHEGDLVGTPHYMAPEQVRGGDVGAAADVWALGCVLYECLTGRAAFSAAHALAAMTRATVDDPIAIAELRPETPEPLEELVRAMLAKDPDERPKAGDELVAALEAVEVTTGQDTIPNREPRNRWATGMATENRVRSLLFARTATPDADLDRLRRVAERHGYQIEAFADGSGSLLLTDAGIDAPREESARAARVALALRETDPDLALAVATGRSTGSGTSPVGEVVDRAVATLMTARPRDIRVDRVTADLLEGRFELAADGDGHRLVGEQAAEGARTLLGKPSRWVGRRRELGMLHATFEECAEDGCSRAVLVTGPAGMGKSRLQHEFLRSLEERGDRPFVLRGQGDSLSAGSPFVMIAPGIRRAAGILDGEPAATGRDKLLARLRESVHPDDLERVAAFVGELADIPFSGDQNESLRAARENPMLLGELMRDAFVTWMTAECVRRPVLFVLEDLHWGDLPSISYIDAALHALEDQAFMVLALARPEVHTAFPRIWERRAIDEVRLHPLSARACAEIVRDALGADVPGDTVHTLVERSEGNAFYLEEIVRAASAGESSELPDSVLGMVQARLHALDTEARRVLRAASVFGDVFWEGGVRALVDTEGATFSVGEWLAELARRELISPQERSRLPDEREYQFRHGLVREAAYDMLGDEDRAVAHVLAGEWLVAAGERDGLVLAGHFMRGDDRGRAVEWLRRAAEQALGASDFTAAIERAERAIAAGAEGAALGALRGMQAMACSWLSEHADAIRYGEEAVDRLPEGSREWFHAASPAIVSSARAGDVATFDRLFERAERARPMSGSEPAQIVCLCRGAFQLALRGRMERADEILDRIRELEATVADLDALTVAQIHDARAGRAFCVGDARTALTGMEAAVDAFRRAGDESQVYIGRASIAWLRSELGDLGPAEELCRETLAECQRRGVKLAATLCKMVLGGILGRRPGALDEARSFLREGIDEYRAVGNRAFAGWGYGFLACADLAAGDDESAREHARLAEKLVARSPGLKSWAMALHGRALLGLGASREALERASASIGILRAQGGIVENGALPPLVYAEALHAEGDVAGARTVIAEARDRVLERARALEGTHWRETYLALPDPARTLELAAAWLAS